MNILQTANIKGDIKTPVISIEEGAQFNGKVNMGTF
jgi:cytoskeletal protein CcmA (bactofilin family)